MDEQKKKRKRTIITNEQLASLEASFEREPWPSGTEKEKLAKILGKTERFVSVWFQNKRARLRKEEQAAKMEVGSKYSTGIYEKPQCWVYHKDNGKTSKCKTTSANTHTEANTKREGPRKPTPDNVNVSEEESVQDADSDTNVSGTLYRYGVHDNFYQTKASCQSSHDQGTGISSNLNINGVGENKSMLYSEEPIYALHQHTSSKMKYTSHPGLNPEAQVSSKESQPENPPTLFRSLISMMVVCEGGIISLSHPQFSSAVNDLLYGIKINQDSRLVYSKDYGLEFV